jgi:arylsulfatase A-like enzyme
MSRHFIWLTPLANLVLFVGVGLLLALLTRLSPRLGGWLSPRLMFALAILPALLVAWPQVYGEAWFVLALGIAVWIVPPLVRNPAALRRRLVLTVAALVGLVVILGGSVFASDWLKHRREAGRALPPADSPNVLFIVLDTVRADRLSLYGYYRRTTPTLERLAKGGIRFDAARATSPWTLPSHASFFTGRLPHELGAQWLTPMRTHFPMLAQYLGSHGYATAGFVANTVYCSYDTDLGSGFTHYEDYILEKLGPLQTAILVDKVLRMLISLDETNDGIVHSLRKFIQRWFYGGFRRDAASVNRGFLEWFDRRPEPARPFFVFLNYFDAHAPYKLPEGATPRFARMPESRQEIRIIYDIWSKIDQTTLRQHYITLARDCYDNCLAYVDEQLGELIARLERDGVLDRTLVVITSDHGEGLGEHDLYEHGLSLYSTEIRVPLLMLPPGGSQPGRVVGDTISLRDLPATIVDLIGLGTGAPFPGRSLARLWRDSSAGSAQAVSDPAISELAGPNPLLFHSIPSFVTRGSLVSLAEGDFVYIRNERDGAEELFNMREDPRELTNRVTDQSLKSILERFRVQLARLKPSPSRVARSSGPQERR